MANGFHSKVDIEKGVSDVKQEAKEIFKEVSKISKDVYESIESKGTYSSGTLDEQLAEQLQEMKKEQERLENIKQDNESKEEKEQGTNKANQEKSYELER